MTCLFAIEPESFATLLLLTQSLVCCIHRLNPHRGADVHREQKGSAHSTGADALTRPQPVDRTHDAAIPHAFHANAVPGTLVGVLVIIHSQSDGSTSCAWTGTDANYN